ncbi:hypothetical protein ONZ45_g10840 [Pleurotus djamor]|nr:hypothetical protein ONZ45_g10840 [Pleurotus djamor]
MSSNVQAQDDIDMKVAHHKGLIRTLLTRRNTYAGVSKLPNELIGQIFVTCTALGKGDDAMSMRVRCQIMLVCTMWRELAMNTPQLWSSVSLRQPKWVIPSLQRSKAAPLVVHLAKTRLGLNLLPIDPLNQETHRFRELYISWTIEGAAYLFPRLFNGAGLRAPLLERLDIDITLSRSSAIQPTMMEHFWMGLNSLRSMTLRNALPSLTPDLPSLTHLNIDITHQWKLLSVSWLLNLLRNTPMLEAMTIGTISSNVNMDIKTNPSLVSLPYLRSMYLTLQSLKEATLFLYLNLPPTSPFISVHFFDIAHAHADARSEPEHVCSCLRRLMSEAAHIPEDNDTHTSPPPALQVTVAVGDIYILFVDDKETASPKFRLVITDLPPQFQLEMIYLTTALSLERIQCLIVSGLVGDDQVLAWANILPLFIHLKAIIVSNVVTLRSLDGPDSSLTSSNPVLKSTAPSNLYLEEVKVNGDNEASPDDWLHFVRTCQIRHERSVPLTKVTLYRCNISEEHVQVLGRYTVVDWTRKSDVLTDV